MHLHPLAAQGVLHQELDNPAGGEELRGCGNVLRPDLLLLLVESVEDVFLLIFIEVLVDPAYRLLLSPGLLQRRIIKHLQRATSAPWAWERAGWPGSQDRRAP